MAKIVLSNITKSFNKPLLNGVSYTFSNGVYGISGVSGAGKTTLLRIILGLCPPDSGTVEAYGSFGAVFQDDCLLEDFSAAKNVQLVCDKDRAEISTLLERLGVDASAPARTLSGGERRRLCLLRALINNPTLIVLDEAFKGLDEENRMLAIDFLKGYLDNAVCINVTHSQDENKILAASALRLEDGKLIEL